VDDHVVSVRHQARPDLLVVGLDAAVRSPNSPRPDEADPEPRRRRGATRPKVASVSRAGHVLPQSRRFLVVIFSSTTPSPRRADDFICEPYAKRCFPIALALEAERVENGTNIHGLPPTEGEPGMNRSVSAAIIAMALVACCSLAWAAPPQGYQSRACGFDLNFNGVLGEPGDCNRICRGDPTNTDIDGNGVAHRQVYVNCSAGTDSTTCGAPGSPCRTLQYALNGSNSSFADHISSPATNQIQAVCFQGICGNAQVKLTQSGAAGTYTRTASGSEPRSFEFPRYPVIISGWDVNADGNYPPNSGETAVVDGNVNGNTNTFFDSGGHSRYEIAHFTIRDYGQACTSGADVGVGYPGGSGDVSHAYWHDLAIIDVNRGCNQGNPPNQSGQILWNNFTGTNKTLRYFAVVNTSIQNWGGYIFRGASP